MAGRKGKGERGRVDNLHGEKNIEIVTKNSIKIALISNVGRNMKDRRANREIFWKMSELVCNYYIDGTSNPLPCERERIERLFSAYFITIRAAQFYYIREKRSKSSTFQLRFPLLKSQVFQKAQKN